MNIHMGGDKECFRDNNENGHVLDGWNFMTFVFFLHIAMWGQKTAPMCSVLICGLPLNI